MTDINPDDVYAGQAWLILKVGKQYWAACVPISDNGAMNLAEAGDVGGYPGVDIPHGDDPYRCLLALAEHLRETYEDDARARKKPRKKGRRLDLGTFNLEPAEREAAKKLLERE